MPQYTLRYFNIRALAEISRLLFAVSGTEYKDERFPIEFTDNGIIRNEWDQVKHDNNQFPFAKIPVLIIDNKEIIAQSPAINRYLAKQFGLFGSNDIESALIDSVGEELTDIRSGWQKESNEQGKIDYINNKIPDFYKRLEAFAKKHGGDNGIVGNKLSLADIQLYQADQQFNYVSEHRGAVDKILSQHAPTIKKIIDNVANNPKIKEWVSKRPQTKW